MRRKKRGFRKGFKRSFKKSNFKRKKGRKLSSYRVARGGIRL